MKTNIIMTAVFLLWGCAGTIKSPSPDSGLDISGITYYGFEINGVLCGYSRMTTSRISEDDNQMIQLDQKTLIKMSALGSRFNTDLELTYHLFPETGQFVYHDSHLKQGQIDEKSVIHVRNDTAFFKTPDGKMDTATPLPADVILKNTLYFPHLKKDFVDLNLMQKTYQTYEVREAAVHTTIFSKVGRETVTLIGREFDAVILDEVNRNNGVKVRWWIDTASGALLKAVSPNNRIVFLTDPSIVDKIETADLNPDLACRTNISIADFQSIRTMKVRATIEPSGLWVSAQGLNHPGQTFTGTVKENLIEGIFEIAPKTYQGENAPPFPPELDRVDSLKQYLEPEALCESGDPVLVRKARDITLNSRDSWEAACRLSQWVAENIDYAIPGGGTARNTYDTRTGECGSHSLLLAAFCRAVGIPARVVWGCMYNPNFGGVFGQHGWTEIFMGKAGWIPVDATAFETDFIDAGHIRLGVLKSPAVSLNAKKIEILDYRIVSSGDSSGQESLNHLDACLGTYQNSLNGQIVQVMIENQCLTLDILDKTKLSFNEPGTDEFWYCKLSDKLFLKFNHDDSGEIHQMELHQLMPLRKVIHPDETAQIPEKFRPFVGNYLFAPAQAEFQVSFSDSSHSLAVYDPMNRKTVRLQPPDENGRWLDEYGMNTIFFETDDQGQVAQMVIDSNSRFEREQ